MGAPNSARRLRRVVVVNELVFELAMIQRQQNLHSFHTTDPLPKDRLEPCART